MKLHYKMFKKGKNWCTMALTTVAIFAGVAFTTVASANSVDDTDANVTLVNVDNKTTPMVSLNTQGNVNAEQDQKAGTQGTEQNVNMDNKQTVLNASSTTKDNNINNNVSNQSSRDTNYMNNSLTQPNQNGWYGNQYYQNGQAVKNNALDIDGQTYYFDANGNMVKDYFLTRDGHDFYFDNSGQMVKDYFLSRWGATYYYDNNGYRYTDQFMHRWGADYYFGLDGVRYTNQFFSRWGATYYYGDGGVRYTDKFMNRWGANYYFGLDGVRYTNQFFSRWGATYYYGDGGVRYTNKFMNRWGALYYFGDGGVLYKNNNFWVDGVHYYSDNNGILTPAFDNSINQYIINNGIQHASIQYDYVIPQNIQNHSYSGTSDGRPNMIVVHETANPNDSIWGEINYERSTYNNAYVHAFVDDGHIIEISNPDYEAWGAYYPANGRAVQFEQVEVYGAYRFAAELANAAYYTAYQMKRYGMVPSIAQPNGTGTLWSHHFVTNYFHTGNHTDPDGYWSRNASNYFGTGYNMWDFLQLVEYEYAKLS